ncbi:MAG: stage III sporulation protein AD [Lachnospiraceae bacterium]|nr:stage III sporulation protein AD [Lachnospiraceae bacterium]
MTIIQISVISIIAVLLGIQFKTVKSEYTTLIIISASLIILGIGISKISQVVNIINKICGQYGFSAEYISVLIKIVGITYICEFASDICKDNGFNALASQVQIFGKVFVLILGIPVFMKLLDTINYFIL